jgi:hypothetical protein
MRQHHAFSKSPSKIPNNHQQKTVVRQNEYFDNGPKGPW